MKYALITDDSVSWFSYLISVFETGECCESFELKNGISNDYLSNLFNREPSFSKLRIIIPNNSVDTFCGLFISKYDFDRIKKLIELYPGVLEYNRLGRLEKI